MASLCPEPEEEEEFISFLFSTKSKHDCFFLVGNESQVKPERFGVVKTMLMAHSIVMRLELEDSKLAEKGVVAVPDIHPDTFRNLLRYVYGQDATATLHFDEADNLLYVAEKYMMNRLKKKLAIRLMSLVNPDNICSLLNNPACYANLELNSGITEILRYETDKVLASPMFLDLNENGFIKILEQDGLNVPEIELWRAALKWGRHNADTEDGEPLRRKLTKLNKHIRFCTLDNAKFCEEVVPTKVLTNDEVVLVCLSVGQKQKQDSLTEISNEIEPRKLLQKQKKLMKPDKNPTETEKIPAKLEENLYTFDLIYHYYNDGNTNSRNDFKFTILTHNSNIELLSFLCSYYFGNSNEISYTIIITRVSDPRSYRSDPSAEPTAIVTFHQEIKYRERIQIPFTTGGRNVTLLANSTYTFRMMKCGNGISYFDDRRRSASFYCNEHLTLTLETHDDDYYYSPFCSFEYKTSNS